MNITIWIFLLIQTIVLLHTLIGCITIPIQGALITDGLGHAVIFGIAVAFLFVQNLHSFLLIIGAIFAGILMNALVQYLSKEKMIQYDSAVGISFSTLFAAGILLVSLYARNIHLDLDMILMGNIEFALYDILIFKNIVMGPRMFYIGLIFLIFLILILLFFYSFLEQILFDPLYATIQKTSIKTYKTLSLMLTSIIIVMSFNILGAIILVGIASAPFAFWWKDSNSLLDFIIYSLGTSSIIAFFATIIGLYFDLSLSGTLGFFLTGSAILRLILKK
jgi:manganese/zinc/iron transport system permease protein